MGILIGVVVVGWYLREECIGITYVPKFGIEYLFNAKVEVSGR